jgi:hypothetical protein
LGKQLGVVRFILRFFPVPEPPRKQQLLAEYPRSDAAPEATHYLGVGRYKHMHKVEELTRTIAAIQKDFPQSE